MPPEQSLIDVDEDETVETSLHSEKRTMSLDEELDHDESTTSSEMSIPSSHFASTVALCMCTLTHSYLLISVFPYSGFMAIELLEVNEETAGSYAGLIASSFMLGRALSSYAWGKWADLYGRTTVLQLSLALSCLFTLLFGVARSFSAAIVFRCFLGLSNGIVGTAKTAVSELAHGNEKLETRGMGLVMGMWGIGFLFCPAISGFLAEPVRQYPNSGVVQRYEDILTKYPFVLPNIVGAAFCIVSLIAVKLCVQETLPREKLQSPTMALRNCARRLCATVLCRRRDNDSSSQYKVVPEKDVELASCVASSSLSSEDGEDDEQGSVKDDSPNDEIREIRLKHGESCVMLSTTIETPDSLTRGSAAAISVTTTEDEATMASLWARRDTRRHLIVYWLYSFVSACLEEAFPLFCISKEAGLGLSDAEIGQVLSGSGAIYAVCQYIVYTGIVNRFGLYGSIKIGTLSNVPLLALIPFSLVFSNGNNLTWPTFVYLSIVLAAYRVFGIVFFSSMAVATNRTVPPTHRATMNGLSMLGGSVTKAIGPAFSGWLVAFSIGTFARFGAVVVFWFISALLCLVAIPSATMLAPANKEEGSTRIDKEEEGEECVRRE